MCRNKETLAYQNHFVVFCWCHKFLYDTPVEALPQDPAVSQEYLMKQIPANAGHKNNLHNVPQFKQAKIVVS